MKTATTMLPPPPPEIAYGTKIAQAALQSIGAPATDFPGTHIGSPEYAAAVSIIFTRATNQTIILGTLPRHVLSTSILCNSLRHDSRFKQIPISEALPGDLILESFGNRAAAYAGIIVDHVRIVSMGPPRTMQNNSSLLEIQHSRLPTTIFRYIGVQAHKIQPLANAGFNQDQPRLAPGQSGGGRWTGEKAPSTTALSGGNNWTPPAKAPDASTLAPVLDYLGDVAEVWKGYGDAITDTFTGLWNTIRHPINSAKGIAKGVAYIAKDPAGALKAIGRQIADDFTNGDPRKAGKLIGQVLITFAGAELSPEKLASLLPKVEAAAAGKAVSFTAEETGILEKALSGEAKRGGAGPVNLGKEGVRQSESEAIAAGEKIKGKEVTFELPSGKRTRSDLLTENEQGLKVREAKKGATAKLSAAQTEMKQTAESGGTVIPRGANAKAAGLKPGEAIKIPQHEVDHH